MSWLPQSVLELELYTTGRRNRCVGDDSGPYITDRCTHRIRSAQDLIRKLARYEAQADSVSVYVGEQPGMVPYRTAPVTRELTATERAQWCADVAYLWALARKLTRAELIECLAPERGRRPLRGLTTEYLLHRAVHGPASWERAAGCSYEDVAGFVVGRILGLEEVAS